jgi:hypothetical protein
MKAVALQRDIGRESEDLAALITSHLAPHYIVQSSDSSHENPWQDAVW